MTKTASISTLKLDRTIPSIEMLEHLEELYRVCIPHRLAEAENYARLQLDMASTLDSSVWMVRSYNNLARCAYAKGELAAEQKYLKNALKLLEKLPDELVLKASISRNLSINYCKKSEDREAALPLLNAALRYATLAGNEEQLAATHQAMGMFYYHCDMREQAIESLRIALSLFEKLSNMGGYAYALFVLGWLYMGVGNFADAIDVEKRSIALFQQIGEEVSLADCHIVIADCYLCLNEPLEALQYGKRAVEIFNDAGFGYGYAMAILLLGRVHVELNDTASAIPCFDEAYEYFKKIGNPSMCADALSLKADIYTTMGKWQDVVNIIDEVVALFGSESPLMAQSKSYLALCNAYEHLGDMNSALLNYRKFFRTERKRLSLQVQRKLAAIGLQEQHPFAQTGNIGKHPTEVLRQSEDVGAILGQIGRVDKFLFEDLRRRVSALTVPDINTQELIQDIILDIEKNEKSVEVWNRFEEDLQQIDHRFVYSLTTQYPNLTPAELRTCALLRMNLSNKEIGSLLNISPRTVDTHRTSIRKKMGLVKKENLVMVLTRI